MVKRIKKQTELPGMPPVDPVYEQAEHALGLRREIDDLKKAYEEQLSILADLMLKEKKTTIRVDCVDIKLKVISAKTSLTFKQKKED